MPIIQNLSEVSNVYLGSEKITDVYAGNDKVKSGQQELPWTQPVLSANGTIGGNAFACAASSTWSPNYAWCAFDGTTNTTWASSNGTPSWIEWYNPNQIKISNIRITSGIIDMGVAACNLGDFYIQVSDDGNNWETVYTGANRTGGAKLVTSVNITVNKGYKYWRLYGVNTYNWGAIVQYASIYIQEIAITATQIV